MVMKQIVLNKSTPALPPHPRISPHTHRQKSWSRSNKLNKNIEDFENVTTK